MKKKTVELGKRYKKTIITALAIIAATILILTGVVEPSFLIELLKEINQ